MTNDNYALFKKQGFFIGTETEVIKIVEFAKTEGIIDITAIREGSKVLIATKKGWDEGIKELTAETEDKKSKKRGNQGNNSEIVFAFDTTQPSENVTDIESLKKIISTDFPTIWFETEACLSAAATLCLKNMNGCTSLNLVGMPSGEKTTVLSFFYGQGQTYISDDFTPKAFVSHSANVKNEDLGEVDMLPKIRNKVLITPELAPLFEAPKDELMLNFSMLTRVLDGEGLNRDSGTHGHRGYSGDYKFVWLGATTPLRAPVWNVMGKLGNRLFFLNMKDKNRADADYLDMFTGKAYEEKVKACRGAVRSFLDVLFQKYAARSLEWDAKPDVFFLPEIIKYAKLLTKLRTTLMTWKSDEDRAKYEHNFPITEEPPRAINALLNLARGHAIINDRKFLKSEDLEIVRTVCFSSMPYNRSEFLKLLQKHEGRLTTDQISTELACSADTAGRTMQEFVIIGLVEQKHIDSDSVGRPMSYVEIKEEFKELIHTQRRKDAFNNKPHETGGVCVSKEELDAIDVLGQNLTPKTVILQLLYNAPGKVAEDTLLGSRQLSSYKIPECKYALYELANDSKPLIQDLGDGFFIHTHWKGTLYGVGNHND